MTAYKMVVLAGAAGPARRGKSPPGMSPRWESLPGIARRAELAALFAGPAAAPVTQAAGRPVLQSWDDTLHIAELARTCVAVMRGYGPVRRPGVFDPVGAAPAPGGRPDSVVALDGGPIDCELAFLLVDTGRGAVLGAAAIGGQAEDWISALSEAARPGSSVWVGSDAVHPFCTFGDVLERPLRELAAAIEAAARPVSRSGA